ncbi:DUF3023 domain-containing protein [Ehrlichia muris]|uniref:Uncharacterized protein n=1 Tax=Ehrlichia muris AS145 TaxID=1423892 RepID=V9RA13_9RICK|nr:DUF3023 domain-containing protein [Ehrlichia muris]AHC39711.1 hypothetical protein EMUR_02290 [Ehrlichia muris AS145]
MFSKLQQVFKGKGESSSGQQSDKKSTEGTIDNEPGGATGGGVSSPILGGSRHCRISAGTDLHHILEQLDFEEKKAEAELCKLVCSATRSALRVEDVTCIGNTPKPGEGLVIYTDRKNADHTDKVLPEGLSLFLVRCTISNPYLKSNTIVENAYPIEQSGITECMVYCLVQPENITDFIRSCRNTRKSRDFNPFFHCVVTCTIMCSGFDLTHVPFSIEEQKLKKCLQHHNPQYIYSQEAERQKQRELQNVELARSHVKCSQQSSRLSVLCDLDNIEQQSNIELCKSLACMTSSQMRIKRKTCIGHTVDNKLHIYHSAILHAKNKVLPQGNSIFVVKATVPTSVIIPHTCLDTAAQEYGAAETNILIYCFVHGSSITNFRCECNNLRKRSHPLRSCSILFSEVYSSKYKSLPSNAEEGKLRRYLGAAGIVDDIIYHNTREEEVIQQQSGDVGISSSSSSEDSMMMASTSLGDVSVRHKQYSMSRK